MDASAFFQGTLEKSSALSGNTTSNISTSFGSVSVDLKSNNVAVFLASVNGGLSPGWIAMDLPDSSGRLKGEIAVSRTGPSGAATIARSLFEYNLTAQTDINASASITMAPLELLTTLNRTSNPLMFLDSTLTIPGLHTYTASFTATFGRIWVSEMSLIVYAPFN